MKQTLGILSVITVICAVIFVFFDKKDQESKNQEPTQAMTSDSIVETTTSSVKTTDEATKMSE